MLPTWHVNKLCGCCALVDANDARTCWEMKCGQHVGVRKSQDRGGRRSGRLVLHQDSRRQEGRACNAPNHSRVAHYVDDHNCAAVICDPGPDRRRVESDNARALRERRTAGVLCRREQQQVASPSLVAWVSSTATSKPSLRWRWTKMPHLKLRVPGSGTPIRGAGDEAPPVRDRLPFAQPRLATVIVRGALARFESQEMRWGSPG